MPSQIIAAIILMHRKGITEETLISRSEWLAQELIKRGKKVASGSSNSSMIHVRATLKMMQEVLYKKKDMFGLSISPKIDYQNILLLSFYRNGLINSMIRESKVSCALAAFGQQIAWKEGVLIERLKEEVDFLDRLFKREFLDIENSAFELILDHMVQLKVIKLEEKIADNGEKQIFVKVQNELMIKLQCSLIWPFVESYWITCVYLFSLINDDRSMKDSTKIIQQIQWFAESMYEERIVEHYESCSQDTIQHALKIFKDWGIIAKNEQKKIKINVTEEILYDLENHLNKFQKNQFAKSVDSPIDIARKSILVDFPFMAKF